MEQPAPQTQPPNPDDRITVRLLDPTLTGALDNYCAHTRRKKADVIREALVALLEQKKYLQRPDPVITPD